MSHTIERMVNISLDYSIPILYQ